MVNALPVKAEGQSPLFCELPAFRTLHKLNARFIAWTELSVYLLSIQCVTPQAEKALLAFLHRKLRSGELVCHWQERSYLVEFFASGSKEADAFAQRVLKEVPAASCSLEEVPSTRRTAEDFT